MVQRLMLSGSRPCSIAERPRFPVMALLPAPAWAFAIDPGAVNSAEFTELTQDDQIHPDIVKAQILWMGPTYLPAKSTENFRQF